VVHRGAIPHLEYRQRPCRLAQEERDATWILVTRLRAEEVVEQRRL
jgi:hypothetical protein